MVGWLSRCCLAVSLLTPGMVYAQSAGSDRWKKEDQVRTSAADLKVPPIELERGRAIPRQAQLSVRLDGTMAQCGASECFDLFYFRGENFEQGPERKNILFIPGGPGDIPSHREDLEYFKKKYNVFYFDPRGAGLSDIDLSKSFDRFLRADFIVNDIEQIRRKELRDEAWDAIYGYSYGTVIAQKYASKFPNNVKRLILEAPVHRRNETEDARRDMVLENLVNIYRNIKFEDPKAPCNADPNNIVNPESVPKLRKENIDVEDTNVTGIVHVFCEDDFSFLHDTQIQTIRNRLKKEYDALEDEYGSLNLITLNYDRLEKDTRFTKTFPYPKEFFIALRKLQSLGAPHDKKSLFFIEEVEPLVTLAMVVGYYSMFDRDSRNNLRLANFPKCKIDDAAPFLEGVELEKKKKICARIDRAMKEISPEQQFRKIESRRALYVLGLYDGINRWIFEMLEDKRKNNEKCNDGLQGEDIQEFVQGAGERRKMLREETARIGIVPGEAICPWDPGEFKHGVQTLILKGGADAIIAKRQAEDFFQDSLKNPHCQGVLIEFPGRGHDMSLRWHEFADAAFTPWANAYRDLVDEFIKPSQSAAEFRKNEHVIKALRTLKAKDSTLPAQGPNMTCPN